MRCIRRSLSRCARALAAAVVLLAPAGLLRAESPATGFLERTFRDDAGIHKYTVFVPSGYTSDRTWPVILYLHGSSARGTDNALQLVGGLAPQVRARAESFPFLVVFPQCEDTESRLLSGWAADSPDAVRALRILDDVEREFAVDRTREILTGWSMGGYGAWSVAAAQPARWSAVVIVAGGGDPADAAKLRNVPVWALHGARDLAVPLEAGRRMIDSVRGAGGRAYFTELPNARHNIGHVVYSDDAVYNWMLDPHSEPRTASLVQNAGRKPTLAEMGRDFNAPFIPAVEIPEAVVVRADRDVMESLAYALPDLVPDDVLAGRVDNMAQTKRAAGMRFNVVLAGITYRGDLERVRINPRRDGWINVQLGLRNLTMEIGSTRVDGFLMSATAGPMQIVVGHERPEWLSLEMRPYIEGRKLRLEQAAARFEIADDNWYVTSPAYVTARGLPILRNRFSASVSHELVQGAAAQKQQIESQVTAAVPLLVERLQERLAEQLDAPRTIGEWPMPAYQPRYKVWPAQLLVDETGLSLLLGMTVASPGLHPPEGPVRRIEREPIRLAELSAKKGLQIGQSGAVIEGVTAAVVGTRTAIADVRDLTIPEFALLGDGRELAAIVPDLKRYGNSLRVRTRIRAVEPMSLDFADREARGLAAGRAAALSESNQPVIELTMRGLRIEVDLKTSDDQAEWTPCAQFDLRLTQRLTAEIERPNFSTRVVRQNWLADAGVTVTGRFAPGYRAENAALDSAHVAALFLAGWRSFERMDLFQETLAPDISIGSAVFRATAVESRDPLIVARFLPARTRITNDSDRELVYELRGPFSKWGGPYRLEPGQFHEYRVPYPLTFRGKNDEMSARMILPIGSHSLYGAAGAEESPRLRQASQTKPAALAP